MKRNTPTYVGRTFSLASNVDIPWKHPHVCGENLPFQIAQKLTLETPPRMWGELHLSQAPQMQVRNTPTYVGRTYCLLKVLCCRWKHPHVCGENYLFGSFFNFLYETPPRMWGERRTFVLHKQEARNTPTYVGRTFQMEKEIENEPKHPHVCGENALQAVGNNCP